MQHPDKEVIRLLIPADSGNHAADAWNVVSLTRPCDGTESEWQVVAAYGPMTLDKAHEFLAQLGVKAVSVENRSDFPILDSLDLPPAEVTLSTEEGIALPRTAALIQQLTSDFGSEYTGLLTRAAEDANHGDQTSYMKWLNAAIDVLAGAGGGARESYKALAIGHIGVFLTEIRADTRSASHFGAMPHTPPPSDVRSVEVDHDRR